MIPVFRPTVGSEEIEAVVEVLRSGWWGLGPKTRQFEEAFAAYVGANHAIGMNSCTAALHLGLKVLDVAGGEVITTPMTFVSTNHAILYNNATPVFADIEADTLNIDPADIERKLSAKTKAIVVVHYGGHPVDLDAIRSLAATRGIPILEDAAHAAGSLYKGKRIGSISDITCFSFHAVKNLATGEGGMITTQNEAFDSRLRRLRWMGINKDTWSRAETDMKYSWHYEVDELGFKCHLSDMAAAIGLVQLAKLEATNKRRAEIAATYSAGFADLAWLETPAKRPYATSAHHNYVIKVPKRDQLMSALQEQGIATGMHYIPNHLFPLYREWYQELPVTERVWKTLVTLPLFPDLSDAEVDHIVECVREFGDQV
jgi:perosamine synthetase